MKKWDKLRGTLVNDTQNGIREMQNHAISSRWQNVRDIAMQTVVGTSVLCIMASLDDMQAQQRAEREQDERRKELRKAAR